MKGQIIALLFLAFFLSSASYGAGFTLESDEISGQLSPAQAYKGYGCSGENISPALRWRNAPPGTKSFAVTVYNPDAPTGSGWWHWVIFNIPTHVTHLKKDAGNLAKKLAPDGSIQSVTDWGHPGFGGACPPKGEYHRHIFTVYALDIEKAGMGPDNLLDATSTPAMLGCLIADHVIAKASLVAYYRR